MHIIVTSGVVVSVGPVVKKDMCSNCLTYVLLAVIEQIGWKSIIPTRQTLL